MSENINTTGVAVAAPVVAKPAVAKKKSLIKDVDSGEITLKNTLLEDVDAADYFYNATGDGGKPFGSFHKVCGYPVDRADLLNTFHKVFKPEHGLLFYKDMKKELYLVIVPLNKAKYVNAMNESKDGDYQRHAISFINEGSANPDSLLKKLEMVKKFVSFDGQ